MSTPPAWYSRARIGAFVESRPVHTFIIVVILINAVILGLETSHDVLAAFGETLKLLDRLCLSIFIVELALKLYAFGWRFFTSPWNVFDFIIVTVALIPGADALAVLRAWRVLRVLRLISVIPSLRRVVDALARALPGIASIAALLVIIFYVAAVMATMLFGKQFPAEYGSLGSSLFSLFQVTTLDSWASQVRMIMAELPWAPWFFIPFVLISAFAVLNLFIAVIVDAMQGLDKPASAEAQPQVPEPAAEPETDVARELAALREQVAELTRLMTADERSTQSATR